MSLKNFYTKFYNQKLLEKNCLNKVIYPKTFVRNSVDNNLEIQMVDSDSSIRHVTSNNLTKLGSSLISDVKVLKYKYNKSLQLKLQVKSSPDLNPGPLLNLNESLKEISTEKKSRRLMLLLNQVNGGFLGYSSGVVGFMPKGQFKDVVKSILKKRTFKRSAANLLFLLSGSHLLKRYLPFRVPFFTNNMRVSPSFQKYNFSKCMKRKRRHSRNFLNFIFLSKKFVQKPKAYKILKKNANVKHEKISRFYHRKKNFGKKPVSSRREYYKKR